MPEPALERPIERIREKAIERIKGIGDGGWFFAQIAGQVAERRNSRGLSQRELAELTGTTQSAIARLDKTIKLTARVRAAAQEKQTLRAKVLIAEVVRSNKDAQSFAGGFGLTVCSKSAD